MPDKKLTDNEIIKALDCCVSANYICPHTCPMLKNKDCLTSLRKNALDLITRQQAENINLKGHLEQLKSRYDNAKTEIERLKTNLNVELDNFASEYDDKIKAEAYKEFAERLREHKFEIEDIPKKEIFYAVETHHIDNLLKEMVGENNE